MLDSVTNSHRRKPMSLVSSAIDLLFSGAVTADDPANAEAFNHRGTVRFSTGDLEGALRDFRAAMRCDPCYPEAWNNCGIVELTLGRPGAARHAFSRALALAPQYAEALNNRGRARQ